MYIIILIILLIILFSLFGTYKVVEGARGYTRGSGTGGNTIVIKKIDELNKTIGDKNKNIDDKLKAQDDKMNYIQQLTLNNYCSMNFTRGTATNKREQNIQTFCRQKAKEYKWDREYYGY
jgi:hypothetical protein